MPSPALLSLLFASAVAVQQPSDAGAIAAPLVRWVGDVAITSDLPAYPEGAVAVRREGIVDIGLLVSPTGQILQHRLLTSGGEALDAAAIAAVLKYRFASGPDAPASAFGVMARIEFRLPSSGPAVTGRFLNVPESLADWRTAPAIETFLAGAGVSFPTVRSQVKPVPLPGRGITGEVALEIWILPDGQVGRVRLKRSLTPDLDREAIRVAQLWRFSPPMRNGQPVGMTAELILSFSGS